MDFDIQDKCGMTSLHHASIYGNLKRAREFIDQYVNSDRIDDLYHDVNIRDNNCMTALHYAVFYGHVKIIQELVKYSDLDLKDDSGRTALERAETGEIRQIIIDNLDFPDVKEPEYNSNF